MSPPSTPAVAIVTGASRGIGAAISHHLAEAGWTVIAAARDAATIEVPSGLAGTVVPVPADVTDPAAVARVFEVAREHGIVELVVNNAGIIDPITRIEDSDPAAWSRAVDVNLKGAYHVLREAVLAMKPQGQGTIINLSSGAANRPMEGWSAYCSTKAALKMLTGSADLEYRQHGIRVMGLSPGTVATDMQTEIRESGINPVSRLPASAHIPPSWVARAVDYLHRNATDEDLGEDFSLKTDAGRDRVGLPRVLPS